MFKGRKLLIATKHKKEQVIAPLLEKELDVKCYVLDDFDTDLLGTFSGEIERTDDPITTVRKKCLMAMQLADADLAIANEGSFGPHPDMFFVSADDEFLIFIDKTNQLEVIVREIITNTNFFGSEIKTETELLEFTNKAQFPSHGLIIRKTKEDFTDQVKGIIDWGKLHDEFNRFMNQYGSVYIETDMRAMFNPTRMKVIEKATFRLIEKIKSFCPNCQTPGFGIVNAKAGLPCELCNFATRSTLSYVYECKTCSYIKEVKYPHGKMKEDPMYCDVCNP